MDKFLTNINEEYTEFHKDMMKKSKKDIYMYCQKIDFYWAIHDMYVMFEFESTCDTHFTEKELKLLNKLDKPIETLYDFYTDLGTSYIFLSFRTYKELFDFVKFYCENQIHN